MRDGTSTLGRNVEDKIEKGKKKRRRVRSSFRPVGAVVATYAPRVYVQHARVPDSMPKRRKSAAPGGEKSTRVQRTRTHQKLPKRSENGKLHAHKRKCIFSSTCHGISHFHLKTALYAHFTASNSIQVSHITLFTNKSQFRVHFSNISTIVL